MKIIVYKIALMLVGLLISSNILYSQPLFGTVSTTKVSCQGGSDGTATVTASGGTSPYTYQWYNPLGGLIGVNITTKNGLTAGNNYRCRIRDAAAGIYDVWFDISENPALIFDDLTSTNPSCNGATGTIVISPLGGVSPYMYSINGGVDFQASNSFNVVAGSYDAVITDNLGCIATYALNPIIISQPSALSIIKDSQIDIKCKGDNTGEIKVTGTGGTGTLTYTLKKSGVPQLPTQTGESGDQITFSTLVAGDYTVEVTDTKACGPAVTPTITLTEPAQVLSVTATPTNATGWCKTDGSILAAGTGGQAPYQYSINGGSLSTPATPSSYTFSLLAPNTYTILVQDANGCTATTNVVVGPTPLNATVTTTDATCFGDKGKITVTSPTGGSGVGYRFTLSLVNPISWKVYIPAPPTPVVFNNLNSSPAPGTSYTVYMIDNTYTGLPSGCNSPAIIGTYNIVSPAKLSALISGTTSICPGGSATISIALTGTPPWNLTYTDGTTPVTVNGILTSPYTFNVSPVVNTTYTVTALSNVSCTALPSDLTGSAIITINALPAITVQPTNKTVCAGGSTTFSVTAAGAGLTYQWQLSTDNGATWNDQANGGVYSNMTTATMSITGATNAMNAYQYRCVVSGTCPPAVNSTAGILTVNALPAITGQPVNSTVCAGGNTTFSVTATGAGLTYQWQLSTDNGVTWNSQANGGVYSNMTTAMMSITGALITMNGYQYRCVVSGTCPPPVNSTAGILTVNALPSITGQPSNQAVCVGGSTTFSVTATGAGLTYQWQLSTDNGATWNDQANGGVYSNMTTSTMSITGALITMNGYQYRCVVSGTCPPPVNSNAGILTVNVPPSITGQPTNKTVCAGGSTTFSVTATGAGLTYQWQLSTDNGVTWNSQANGGVYSNMTTATMSITGALITMNGYQYRCVVSGTCPPPVNSTAGILTVNALPSITGQPSNQAVCVGGSTTFSVTATGAGPTYQWQLSTDNGATWNDQANGGVYSNMTTSTMSITGALITMNGYQYRCVVSGTCPPPVNSNAGILTVNVPPSITGQPTNKTVCAGGSTTFSVTATGAGLTYQWQLSTDNGVTWNSQANGGVYSNMTTATMSITGATNAMNAYQYRCVVSGTCPPAVNSTAGILTVNALPAITGQPVNSTVCAGGNTTFSVTATGAGLTYQWQLSTDNGVTWNSQANGGVYSNMTTATMSITGALITMNGYQYRCVVSGTCPPSVNSAAGILTVNTPASITGQPANGTVCAGGSTTFSVTATGAGLTYQWQLSTDNGATWNSQANGGVYSNMTTSTMSITGALITMNGYQYRCVVSGTCPPSVNSNAGILTVNALPSITGQPSNQAVCVGGSTTFSVTATGAGLTYQWQLSTDNGVTWNDQANGGVYSNMTTSTMSITGALITMNGYQYRCVVGGTCPPSVNSNAGILTVNALPSITGQPGDQAVCVGGSTTFSVTATGAGPTYQWQLSTDNGVTWNDQANGGVYSNMTTATMSITGALITMNGYQYRCVVSGTCPPPVNSNAGILTVNTPPSITGQPGNSTVCAGGSTTFSVTATGAGLTYQWQLSTDNGVTWNDQANGGVYSNMTTATMTITGATNAMNAYQYRCVVSGTCPPFVNSNVGILTVNDSPSSSIFSSDASICLGNSAILKVDITGGTSPYIVIYNDGTSDVTVNPYISGSDIIVNPISTTTYTLVSVTDANLCPSSGISGTPTVTVNVAPTSAVLSGTQTICNSSNANIVVTIAGGTAPFTVVYNDGVSDITENGYISGSDIVVSPLTTTTYTLISVTDANGCPAATVSGTATITVNLPISWDAITVENVNCHDEANGKITVEVSGIPPFLYSKDDGLTFEDNVGIFTNLGDGDYYLAVQDGNNCVHRLGFPITVLNPDKIIITSIVKVEPSCTGDSDGSITVTSSGGTIYFPSVMKYYIDGSVIPNTTGVFNGLTAGDHIITVEDDNGCKIDSTITLTSPATIVFPSPQKIDITCFGLVDGEIHASATGGTGALTYTLLPGGVITNATGDFTGLSAGTYSVLATDSKGCNNTSSDFTIVEPNEFTFGSVASTPLNCNGDNSTITLVANGGTAPISYTLTDGVAYSETNTFGNFTVPAGTYDYIITDANNCSTFTGSINITEPAAIVISTPQINQMSGPSANDGSIKLNATGGTGLLTFTLNPGGVVLTAASGVDVEFTDLGPGTYSIDVTDANGCSQTVSDLIIGLLDLTLTPTHITCNGNNDGEIVLTINSGTAPYTITWTGPGGPLPAFNDMLTITGLSAGLYTVNVVDAIGVTGTASTTINEPSLFTAAWVSTQDKLCFGDVNGSVTFDIAGGAAPYTISWTEGGTPRTEIVNAAPFIATNVAPGTYDFTITDASTCGLVVINSIVLADPQKLNISNIVGVDINCNGDANGSITVTAAGGTVPLSYTIAGPVNTSVPDGVFNNLLPGDYTISLTDANGCVASSDVPLTVTIVEPSALSVTILTPAPLACPNVPDGYARLQVSGGTPDYTYLWSNGQSTPDLENILSGDYSVTITDAHGCVVNRDVTVAGPEMLEIADTTITRARCSELFETGDDFGSIKIESITGGTGPTFTYTWDYPDGVPVTGDFIDKLSSGIYTVTITDENGCTYDHSIFVPFDPDFYMSAYASKDTLLCGSGTLNLVAIENGINPARTYTYSWYEAPNTSGPVLSTDKTYTVNPANSTQYYLEIRNDGGCLSSDYVNIGIYPKTDMSVPLYISALQRDNDNSKKDTIIAILSGSSYNLDVIPKNTDYVTTFKWEPEILFNPADSWNSSIYTDKEIYTQIPANRIATLTDPQTKSKTKYILIDVKAVTEKGCKDSLRLYAKIINNVTFGNVFSPNGDGLNDRWEVPRDYLFPDLNIEIFDRWGARVWSASGDKAAKGWDGKTDNGKELPIGTYYYVVKFNVNTSDKKWEPVTGSVTIVR